MMQNQNKIYDDSGALLSKEVSDPPILLTKSDGSYLYLTTDLGTVYFREQNGDFNKYLYVVDQRQSNHFNQLFKTVKYFELSDCDFIHISYGTVNGKDNKPLKTRDGGVYKLEELLEDVKEELLKKSKNQLLVEQLANSILTYSDLLPSRNQNYKFEIEKFVDINGKTGIYLQYAQVRAKKILDQSSVSNKNILLKIWIRMKETLFLKFQNYHIIFSIHLETNHIILRSTGTACRKYLIFLHE